MSLYVDMIEDNGDLVDIDYYCSATCAGSAPNAGAWPGGMEVDYDCFCASCGTKVIEGLENDEA